MITQQISKSALEQLVHDLPDMVDLEDVMTRLYLLQKIQAGEHDIQAGRLVSHEQVVARLSQQWQP